MRDYSKEFDRIWQLMGDAEQLAREQDLTERLLVFGLTEEQIRKLRVQATAYAKSLKKMDAEAHHYAEALLARMLDLGLVQKD